MSFRQRLTLSAAAIVLGAVVLACIASYVAVRSELLGQIDDQLHLQGRAFAQLAAQAPPSAQFPRRRGPINRQLSPSEGGPLPYIQGITPEGKPELRGDEGSYTLPIDDTDRRLAARGGESVMRDVDVDGVTFRLLTVSVGDRGAVQLARPLDATNRVLSRLRLFLGAFLLIAVLLAAALGRLTARRITAPLREVTEAAEHIGETEDLSRRIAVGSDDEVGHLARRFNSMLDRLEASSAELAGSVAAQRQLVADASHELRTPITSLRTNLEVLLDGAELDERSREMLIHDLREQTEHLSALVGDVIDLARGDVTPTMFEDVRLDEVVQETVAIAARHHPHITFDVTAEPCVLDGLADRLGRAVSNLLDNAAKHSGAGTRVEVVCGPSGVSVRDFGAGVADEDLPHLFDRFYRGQRSRDVTGSGLGLAIVRQVAEIHGGTAEVANAPGGGTIFTIRLDARPILVSTMLT